MHPRTHTRRIRIGGTAVAAAFALLGALVLAAMPAMAHIQPDPASVHEGAAATIHFDIEHGCGESPTTKLEMQLPEGVTGPTAATSAVGWTTRTAGRVISWSGPGQAPHTPFTLSLTATMPKTAGTIHFPIVQTCQTGSLSWIQVQQPGQPEPQYPAPAVLVLAPGEAAPPTTADADADATATSTTAQSSSGAASSSPATTVASSTHKSKSSNTGLIVGIVVAVVVIGGAAGAAILRSRRSAT